MRSKASSCHSGAVQMTIERYPLRHLLLATLVLLAGPALSAPCYCKFKEQTEQQKRVCLLANEAEKDLPKTGLSSWKCEITSEYPVIIKNGSLFDPSMPGKQIVSIEVPDKNSVLINKDGPNPASISSDLVLEWVLVDASRSDSSFNSTKAAFTSLAAGIGGVALGGGGFALLLAPIAGVQSGINEVYTGSYRFSIRSLQPSGGEKTTYIEVDNLLDADAIEVVLKSSGLKAGERNSSEFFGARLKQALPIKEERLKEIEVKVAVGSKSKPWCRKIDKTRPEFNSYLLALLDVNTIRAYLKIPPYSSSYLSDSYLEWLKQNQGMKDWAKANPVAAQKLSFCPK